MKFSICMPTGFEGVMYPIPFVEPTDFIKLGRLCERLGYDSVWGNDHITTQNYVRDLFPGQQPAFYEPLITLTAIGAATSTLRLGTALLVLPMRDPVYLAKQVTTLDQLYQRPLHPRCRPRRLSRGVRGLELAPGRRPPRRHDGRRPGGAC